MLLFAVVMERERPQQLSRMITVTSLQLYVPSEASMMEALGNEAWLSLVGSSVLNQIIAESDSAEVISACASNTW